MKMKYTKSIVLLSTLLLLPTSAIAQDAKTPTPQSTPEVTGKASGGQGKISSPVATALPTRTIITPAMTPMELARAAYLAQGGEKYRDLKSMLLTGTVDLYGPNSLQSVPGKFAIVTAGDRSRTEFQSLVFNYRQISDGTRTYTSVPQMEMPSPNKFGINVLMKFDQPGYVVSALPDNKKLRAFRITDPEGNSTDFFVSPETGRVMTFTVPYRGVTFGMDFKSFKEIDGVLVPGSFTQRLEMQQGAAYADFKVKVVKLNPEIAADMFEMPAP